MELKGKSALSSNLYSNENLHITSTYINTLKGGISMLELQEIGTERSLHLYRTLAHTFKSVNEHAVSGSKVHGFNPTAYGVLEVLYIKEHNRSSR